jgi:hypothetical protein
MDNGKSNLLLRILSCCILTCVISLAKVPNSYAWDILRNDEQFGGVRTNFNPSFGAFAEFFPDDGSQKSQDIVDYGFFGLNIICDTGEKIVRLQYSKWDSVKRDWFAVPLAPVKRINIKFGSSQPFSWSVANSEWWEDGSRTAYISIILNNPTLFMKKIGSVNSISFPIEADRKNYQVKFITKGFKKFNLDFKKEGCA